MLSDCQRQTIVKSVVAQRGLAVFASCTLAVVSSSLGTDLLISKHNSSTTRTILLGILGLHRAGVPGLQVDV